LPSGINSTLLPCLTPRYICDWSRPQAVAFLASSFAIFLWLLLGLWGYIDLYLTRKHYLVPPTHPPSGPHLNCSRTPRWEEDCRLAEELLTTVNENLMLVIPILAMTLNTLVQSATLAFRGKRAAAFLTKWKNDLSYIKTDVGKGLRRQVVYELVFIFVVILVLVTFYGVHIDQLTGDKRHFIRSASLTYLN
jgi:hypothetical protein